MNVDKHKMIEVYLQRLKRELDKPCLQEDFVLAYKEALDNFLYDLTGEVVVSQYFEDWCKKNGIKMQWVNMEDSR